MDNTYNGWSNYQTWVVNLWMDNEQGSHEMVREWAQECADDCDGDRDQAATDLANRLEAMHDEAMADIVGVVGVFGDLLGHALGCVDWLEIAEHCFEDVEWPEADAE